MEGVETFVAAADRVAVENVCIYVDTVKGETPLSHWQ